MGQDEAERVDLPLASDPAPACPLEAGPQEAGPLEDGTAEAQIAAALGIGRNQRHMLLCVGPSCVSETQGLETWSYLKTRLKELEAQGILPVACVNRSKVSCLRICRGGPILVIYPEGTWYRAVTPQNCARIIDEHLGQGRVVEELAFAHNPL
ncbi:MAG: ferredoxin [Planctomycetota bacterium]